MKKKYLILSQAANGNLSNKIVVARNMKKAIKEFRKTIFYDKILFISKIDKNIIWSDLYV